MAQVGLTDESLPRLFRVMPQEVPVIWPGVSSWLERAFAFSEGQYTADSLFTCLMKQTHQLWIAEFRGAPYAAAITQVMQYPSGAQVCLVEVMGGEEGSLDKLKKVLADLEHWALSYGCTGIQMETRPGMARFLSKLGYETQKFTVSKNLKRALH